MVADTQFRDYLAVIKKHEFIICLSLLTVVGSALSVGVYLPKIYATSALILLVQPSSPAGVSSASVFQSVLSGGFSSGEIETISQRFTADSMLKHALDNLEETEVSGVQYTPSIGRIKKSLSAKNRPDTDFIEISLKASENHGGERFAAAIVNQLIWDLQDMREEEDLTRTEHRRGFLTEKLADLLDQIQDREDEAFEFVHKRGSPVVWQAEIASSLEQRTELTKAQMEFSQTIESSKTELRRLKEELTKYPEFTKASESANLDPLWSQYQEQLTLLKVAHIGLEAKLGENAPEIRAHQAQIEELESELASFGTSLPLQIVNETRSISAIYANLQERILAQQSSIVIANSNLAIVNQHLRDVDQHIAEMFAEIPESELLYQQLNRKILAISDLSKEIYKQSLEAEMLLAESEFWRKNKTRRKIRGGIEMVDSAVPRKIVTSPRLKLIFVISAIVGLCLGLSVALIFEYLVQPVEVGT